MAAVFIKACCYILLGNFAFVRSDHQKFAIEPQNQTAIKGTKVIFPCRVINLSGIVQWTKDGFALGIHRTLPDYERYRMIGNDDEGDYSLQIYPTDLEDDSIFQCQVSPGKNNEPGLRSKTASLTVLIHPQKPEILQGSSMNTTEDREIELECISRKGRPAAELTWIDGLGNVVSDKAEYKKEPVERKLETARSILRITPKKEHHNTTFKCQAQNTAEKEPQNTEIRLYVEYPPKVKISIANSNEPIVEGMDVRITCHVDANPSEVTYRWWLNNRTVYPVSPTEIVIQNISREDHDKIVKCEAYNTVGKSEDSETLYIQYSPRFRRRPQSIQEKNGTQITLFCDVDANPLPTISWIQEKTRKVVGESANYTMVVNEENFGRYFCTAHAVGFQDIRAEALVLMEGSPMIRSHSTQYGMLGETINLECIAYSVPKADKVIWAHDNQIITSDNIDYTQNDESEQGMTKSVLTIKQSTQKHFGNYNCTVVNGYGLDSGIIILKAQKGFPIFLAFVGVVGGVVVVVTVILIIILCQRKVKKEPPPPPAIVIDSEKQCKDSDRSSNISDIKLEIRTGSSASNTNCDLDYSGGGHDTDSIITRIAPPSLPTHFDHRFSINRYSSADYPDPIFPPKSDCHNNNGYVPYVDYARDYNPPASSLHSLYGARSPTSSTGFPTMNSLDLRHSSSYVSPHLRSNSPSIPPLPNSQPPPPPYCTLRNGSVPHVSKFVNTPSSQYIVANSSQQAIIKKGSLATHV